MLYFIYIYIHYEHTILYWRGIRHNNNIIYDTPVSFIKQICVCGLFYFRNRKIFFSGYPTGGDKEKEPNYVKSDRLVVVIRYDGISVASHFPCYRSSSSYELYDNIIISVYHIFYNTRIWTESLK